MKLPRDISGGELISLLSRYGYQPVHQSGSHQRLYAIIDGKAHRITIPLHPTLKVGTLYHILKDIAEHQHIPLATLVSDLFGR